MGGKRTGVPGLPQTAIVLLARAIFIPEWPFFGAGAPKTLWKAGENASVGSRSGVGPPRSQRLLYLKLFLAGKLLDGWQVSECHDRWKLAEGAIAAKDEAVT